LPLCELTTSREFYRPPRMRGGRITFHGSGISPLLKPAANPLEKIADTGHIGIGGGGIRRISVERPDDGECYWKLRSKFHPPKPLSSDQRALLRRGEQRRVTVTRDREEVEMTMPGFNADAALYPRRARYQARAVWPGLRQAGVVPSRRNWNCWEIEGDEEAFCCQATDIRGAHGAQTTCCSGPGTATHCALVDW